MNHKPHRYIIAAAIATLIAGSAAAQDLSPEVAVKRMKVADGFEVRLVAAEPLVRQPVTMSFDDRGRLWVIQYLQYPFPAGLKPVHVDKYLRTKYDRVPEPPPLGPRGNDKITILYDRDENGRFRKAKDFVTGLNLASGMALGHGGVFVAQPPYLLFYADKNGDDTPDGDPEVLLKGFGMEDSHAFANSLQWGPDGWLYGAHGSTSYANIRGISFVQGIWRYHPITKKFELFSEGGGNTWGLDFDRQGNVIAGTNFGRRANLHQMQGAYYVKNFVKHGELKNPHAYGYFEHIPYEGFKGGHVTCGGVVYQGGAYPDRFNNMYIASNPLSNFIGWHKMAKQRSTFKAEHGGVLIDGNDPWFRPIDCLTGPDGAVYIADWYDKRISHHDPRDNWDRRNGRVYKLQVKDAARPKPFDLAKLSSNELVKLLSHKNSWYRSHARRLLAERRDKSVIPALRKVIDGNQGQLALEALWALYVSGGFTTDVATRLLNHPMAEVRAWTARLLGDELTVGPAPFEVMLQRATKDDSELVRSQLACTARRLPGSLGLRIVHELLKRNKDIDDPFIPLLIWWAIEQKTISDRAEVMKLLATSDDWRQPMTAKHILERLGRRYMAEGKSADYETCAWLLDNAPSEIERLILIRGMDKALQGNPTKSVPAPLRTALARFRKNRPSDALVLRFAMRLGDETASRAAMQLAGDAKKPQADRVALLATLGELRHAKALPLLLRSFRADKSNRIKQAALSALQSFPDDNITGMVMQTYPKLAGALRNQARSMLISREKSALQLLQAIDGKMLAKEDLTLEQVRQIHQFKNKTIHKIIEKHWGKIAPITADDKLGRIRHYRRIFAKGPSNLGRGRFLFNKLCATCHTMFGEGNKIGPDLTGVNKSREYLLMHIVDPSAVQRMEYANYLVITKDGRNLTGVVKNADEETITLVNAKNEMTEIARARIDELLPSPTSLMPEKILEPLNDQEFRDLFAYLEVKAPPANTEQAQPQSKKKGKPLTVCLVSGSLEYNSDKSLAKLKKHVEDNYNIRCTWAKRVAKDDLQGLENLKTCDVAFFFTRRMTIGGKQLQAIKDYCKAGKPIVAVRTASHGFQKWLEFDKLVLGGNYHNHFGNGPICKVTFNDKDHPILKGVKPFQSVGSLYKNSPIAKTTQLLLTGAIPGHSEPVAWTHIHNGGRVFYTSLGHERDFEHADFLRMIVNGIYWTSRKTAN